MIRQIPENRCVRCLTPLRDSNVSARLPEMCQACYDKLFAPKKKDTSK